MWSRRRTRTSRLIPRAVVLECFPTNELSPRIDEDHAHGYCAFPRALVCRRGLYACKLCARRRDECRRNERASFDDAERQRFESYESRLLQSASFIFKSRRWFYRNAFGFSRRATRAANQSDAVRCDELLSANERIVRARFANSDKRHQ